MKKILLLILFTLISIKGYCAIITDGSSQYVLTPYGSWYSLSNMGNFTLSCWIKIVGITDVFPIIIGDQTTTNNAGVQIYYLSPNHCLAYSNTISGEQQFTPTNGVLVGTWYFVTINYNSSTKDGKLYINGDLSKGCSVNFSAGLPSSNRGISWGGETNQRFYGKVCDVIVYNRLLSNNEILSCYVQPIIDNSVVGLWRVDENSGTTIYSYAVTKFNGNATYWGSTWDNDYPPVITNYMNIEGSNNKFWDNPIDVLVKLIKDICNWDS